MRIFTVIVTVTWILLKHLACVQCYNTMYLDNLKWSINGTGPDSRVVQATGAVPGTVHTILLESNQIPDPLFRDNDVKTAWIGQSDWTFTRTFDLSQNMSMARRRVLICEGLDTIATVKINDVIVGHSNNMFVQYIFDVTEATHVGENTISITFKSPVREAMERAGTSSYVIPPECPPALQNGECYVNQLRKEQCSFSWDWGPSIPTMGIWQSIHIHSYHSAFIRDATATAKKVGSQWQIDAEVFFVVNDESEETGVFTAILSELNVNLKETITVSPNDNIYKFTLYIPTDENNDVVLWWPNGYGQAKVYDIEVIFTTPADSVGMFTSVGFRTVELVQEQVSTDESHGLSFYFKINGVPIFLKGSNWMPINSLDENDVDYDRLYDMIQAVKDVGINTIRVWGGGVYESREFYEQCDDNGIMVWQDLMFTNSMYPADPDFLQSVSDEIRYQIRRLKYHPSIILWAGNTENERALRENIFNTTDNYQQYYEDYVKLYVDTIQKIVKEEDDTREYLLSSPSNGKQSIAEGYVATDPNSEQYGDIHFYDYTADLWDHTSFKIPRMATEYGVQSWCNNQSLDGVYKKMDYRIDSAMSNHRQHHQNGNLQMATEVNMHMNLPSNLQDDDKFADFIYFTQINQAMSVRAQTEHYRRYQNRLLSDGRGLTMGALYWQLNDVWQAPTWSSIDYEGGWKMLHYYAKNFFNKLLVSPYLQDYDTLDVMVVVDEVPIQEVRDAQDNKLSFKIQKDPDQMPEISISDYDNTFKDTIAAIVSGVVTMSVYNYNSLIPLMTHNISYSLTTPAESILNKKVSDILSESGCPSRATCMLYFSVPNVKGDAIQFETWLPLADPKNSALPPANIQFEPDYMTTDINNYEFTLTTDAVALYVWLSSGNLKGRFSENGFAMVTPKKTIKFFGENGNSQKHVMSQMQAKSIVDVLTDASLTPDSIVG